MIAARRALVAAAVTLFALACGDGAVSPNTPAGVITAQVRIEGQPFADATLLLATTDGRETSILTDDDGRARFDRLELGSYTLEATAPGKPVEFDAVPVAVLSTTVPTASIAVTGTWDRSGALTVRVLAGGDPVEGSTVSLVGPFRGYGRIETTGMTDAEGRAQFPDLVPGTYAAGLAAFDATRYTFSMGTRAIGIRSRTNTETVFEGERLPSTARVAPARAPAYVSMTRPIPTPRPLHTPWSISTRH
jgi:hypothetical protein